MANKASRADIDIAIIGGGVSGVYSAWKLRKKYPRKRIVVFEGGDHIGGRLLSVKPPEIDNMVAELGGMRILENTQKRIVNLINALNADAGVRQKIHTYDFPVDESQNIAFLRNVHLRLSDFTRRPDRVPYQLSFLERGNPAGTIMVNAINQIVPGITDPAHSEAQRRDMAQKASFGGRPLYEQGFWNVLMRVISNEAYQLGVDAGGYSSVLFNWNAADAIPWYLSDFGITPEYKGFQTGFQSVPLALADLFCKLKGEIRLNTKVNGFTWNDKTASWRLTTGTESVSAASLILAMPRRSLELISAHSPALKEAQVRALVGSVTPRPLFKLFTTYHDPWWRAAGYTDNSTGKFVPVQSGRTITDLPVRQTYYWPTNQGKPATRGPAMLMASYDDGDNIGFWDGLRPKRSQRWGQSQKRSTAPELFVSDAEIGLRNRGLPHSAWFDHRAPKRMVAEIARQLELIHGLGFSPEVRFAAFRDWGEDPFGGGWNSWNIGVKSPEVMRKIVQPVERLPLYICGEAYSNGQGWVEGALETADMVLQQGFSIDCPNVDANTKLNRKYCMPGHRNTKAGHRDMDSR